MSSTEKHGTTNVSFAEDDEVFLEVSKDVDQNTAKDGHQATDGDKPKMSIRKMMVILCILMTEMCERLTYYSVLANIALFGTSVLKLTSGESADMANVFSGVVFLTPIVGGLISDQWAGKFRTIMGSGFIYCLGVFLLPASAIDYRTFFGENEDGSYFDMTVQTRRALFLSGLVFVAIGTGGIKANVGPFGAQQLLEFGEDAVKSFFNWFYWFINVGALVSYTAVAYVQQNISFAWGFFVPLASMLLAILIFTLGRPFYVQKPPGGSVLAESAAVMWQAMTHKKVETPDGEKLKFFDKARKRYGGSFTDQTVESVSAVLRILPVFSTIILYWALYQQMTTTFLFQGERLNVEVGNFKIPATGLNAFDTIIIIILIPIFDRLIYPCFEKIGRPLSHLHRIGIGLVLAALSVVVAGLVEMGRKTRMEEVGGTISQTLGGEKFNASDLSVFVQVPQYALVGASEVFTSVCGIEFAYTQAPKSMQGVLTGLFYMTSGLGGFLADGILRATEKATQGDPWFADEINNAHLEYYFFLLAVLMLVNFLVFLVIAKSFRYRNKEYDDLDEETVHTPPDAEQATPIDLFTTTKAEESEEKKGENSSTVNTRL